MALSLDVAGKSSLVSNPYANSGGSNIFGPQSFSFGGSGANANAMATATQPITTGLTSGKLLLLAAAGLVIAYYVFGHKRK
jgi:hypothetical protein